METTPGGIPTSTGRGTPSPQRGQRTPLYEASNAERYGRQELIKSIEDDTKRKLLCFTASAGAEITRLDPMYFIDLLHGLPRGSAIDLLLHSPGGDIDAAEKIAILLQKHVGATQTLRVIIPDYAKSAGTLIALAADQLLMSDSSEIGIIDPQITTAAGESYSARSYLDAYETHSSALREDPKDPVARTMLMGLDPVLVRKYQRMTSRATSIAGNLLKQRMISEPDAAEKCAEILGDTTKWLSHGQVITHELAAGSVGLTVRYLPMEDGLWQKIWRLYCQQRMSLVDGGKLFESNVVSLVNHG